MGEIKKIRREAVKKSADEQPKRRNLGKQVLDRKITKDFLCRGWRQLDHKTDGRGGEATTEAAHMDFAGGIRQWLENIFV